MCQPAVSLGPGPGPGVYAWGPGAPWTEGPTRRGAERSGSQQREKGLPHTPSKERNI
nr:MAG TPA: hypothetical protein [Caudoviricetes sp.]